MFLREAEFRNRALGVMIGGAVGDALGAPLEFGPRYPMNTPREMTGGGGFGWKPGETTDDTDMAVAVARMYLDCNKYDQERNVYHFLRWYDGRPKDAGAWTSRALRTWDFYLRDKNKSALVDITPEVMNNRGLRGDSHPIIQLWKRCGSNDAGNGGIMRCWPTAIACPDKKDRLRETTWICEDTHPDPRCVASSQAVVEVMNYFIRGAHHSDVYGAWQVALATSKWEQTTFEAVFRSFSLPWSQWSNSGYTIGTLDSALAACFEVSSFESGLTACVNVGNDSDSAGAVAGALLGARFGYNAIPDRWKKKLIKHDELVTLGNALIDVRISRRRKR
jgi:ADP-ribosyl-[dinitrogen reductase] hydrolase